MDLLAQYDCSNDFISFRRSLDGKLAGNRLVRLRLQLSHLLAASNVVATVEADVEPEEVAKAWGLPFAFSGVATSGIETTAGRDGLAARVRHDLNIATVA